jgi:hypothetical protein
VIGCRHLSWVEQWLAVGRRLRNRGHFAATMLETNRSMGASLKVGTRWVPGRVFIMLRVLVASALIFSIPAFAGAQHRGGMGAAGQPVVVSPHIAVAPAQGAGARVAAGIRPGTGLVIVHRTGVGANLHRSVNIASLPVFRTEFPNAPGLGFDFPHMAAVNGRRGHGRFIGANSFGFSGFLLSSPGLFVDEGQPVENQPVIEEIATPSNAEDADVRGSEGRNFPGTVSVAAPAPQRDAAEYVFVRRDGGLVFAVAYSWDHGTLRYITREGIRGSVMQAALDMEATQQFNEQRGVDFRLPA